ncbi:MAG: ABC transporter ATP-binding protein/permease [Lachnospiraceae bacterium]|jgi:ABC-type multidrug transport system fused ATPase/permease subunit|nr:ABC transporter ATP-binding protein/permease [Lachnospiraceae bacterium]
MEKDKIGLLAKLRYILDRKQKRKFLLLGVMILIGGMLETLGVSGMLPILQGIMDPDSLNGFISKVPFLEKLYQALGIQSDKQLITILLVTLMIIFVVKNIYSLFLTYRQNSFITQTRNKMISRVMREFLNRPYEDYLGADIPTVFRLTDSDIPQSFSLLLALLQLGSELTVSTLLFIILLLNDWAMTLFVIMIFGCLTLLIIKVLKPRINKIGRQNQAIQSRIAKWRIQAIYGLKDVKVLNREEFFIRNYYESGKVGANVARNYAVYNNIPRLLIETSFIVGFFSYILIYITGGGQMEELITTLGIFGMAAIRIMPSFTRINTYVAEISYTQPSLDYLYWNLKEGMKTDAYMAAEKEKSRSPKLTLGDHIALNKITFAYPDTDKNIFTDACMIIPKGKSVGIIGASGAGKSTIVDILLGLLHAQSGTITCDGRDIFENYESWLAQVGYIPQAIYLVDESIRDNIAFGIDHDKIDEQRIWTVLAEAQMKEFVESLPDGLNTTVGDRGVRLSGGQRQRIGIARALYHNPEILVFDEATSALDTDTEKAVMDAINSFHGKKTMVIIAHRLNTIAKCDMVYKVDQEKLVETTIRSEEQT